MERRHNKTPEAYLNEVFLASREARALRILSEYIEPLSRFDRYNVEDTIVVMGSARIQSRQQAEEGLEKARNGDGDLELCRRRLEMSEYYEAARELARRVAEWSKQLPDRQRRFLVCTGGGPGIMEAANRGAAEGQGLNVGLTISIPKEEFDNSYVTRELSFHFHYFFMRKFWFAYLAKAVIVFPGGFGTLDELFELLTLVQTRKIHKHLPIVLFGNKYWSEVIDFDALVRYGNIDPQDVKLVYRTDSVDAAFYYLVDNLSRYAVDEHGAIL